MEISSSQAEPRCFGRKIGFCQHPGFPQTGEKIRHRTPHQEVSFISRLAQPVRQAAAGRRHARLPAQSACPCARISICPARASRMVASRIGARFFRQLSSPDGLPTKSRAASLGDIDFSAPRAVSSCNIACSAGSEFVMRQPYAQSGAPPLGSAPRRSTQGW